MAGFLSFVGRVMFAFLFLSSGLQKVQHFNIVSGGPDMEHVEPKLDHFFDQAAEWAGTKLPVSKAMYPYFLLIAILLELVGGFLFVFKSRFGAQLLLLFMIVVTPIMHNFWDLPANSPEQLNDLINFFKNTAITGALLFFLGA